MSTHTKLTPHAATSNASPDALPPAPPNPTIPLTPAARTAYQDLYTKNELAIQATTDPGVLEALNSAQLDVRNILTKDNMYRLHATTALYDALLLQINTTNSSLKDLQKQIQAIIDDFAHAADIVGAIQKVLDAVAIL